MLVFNFMIANIGEPPWGCIHSSSFSMKTFLSSKYSSCRLWHLHVCRSYFLYLFFSVISFPRSFDKRRHWAQHNFASYASILYLLGFQDVAYSNSGIWHITAELHIILSEVFLLLLLDKFHSSCFYYTTWVYCYISHWEK